MAVIGRSQPRTDQAILDASEQIAQWEWETALDEQTDEDTALMAAGACSMTIWAITAYDPVRGLEALQSVLEP